jgi:hypothetical protein
LVDRSFPTENHEVVSLDAFRSVKDGADKVCSCKPSPTVAGTNTIIERGKAALSRLEHDKQTWPDWRVACEAQLAVQTLAMAAAQTNVPQGPRYRNAIKLLLEHHGFDRINKGTRCLMCEVARNINAIEAWRSKIAADAPDELLELNHPRVVLARWKRSLGQASAEDAEEPKSAEVNPLLNGWNKSTPEQRTTGLSQIPFNDFRQSMPGDWSKPMKDHVARLRAEDREPDFRITRAVQAALNHIEIADDSKTSKEAVAPSHEKAALDELRKALKALHAIKRPVRDLDVGLFTSPKARRRSS